MEAPLSHGKGAVPQPPILHLGSLFASLKLLERRRRRAASRTAACAAPPVLPTATQPALVARLWHLLDDWLLGPCRRRLGALALSPVARGVALVCAAGALLRWYARRRRQQQPPGATGRRVCVVGGGIAGAGAAWSLRRSGFDVTLYEQKPALGGNAKSHGWQVPLKAGASAGASSSAGGDGVAAPAATTREVRTGLSVLAWPGELFHTYNALLAHLGIETVEHVLRFFVGRRRATECGDSSGGSSGDGSSGAVECVFAHDRESHTDEAQLAARQPWLAADLARWRRLAAFVRRVNGFFAPAPLRRAAATSGPGGGAAAVTVAVRGKSCYRNSLLNPLNVVPLRALARWGFGVSDRFWGEVFVPVHTSTFLEAHMDDLPAVLAELLEDIVPLAEPGAPPVMRTWAAGNADAVFEALAAGLQGAGGGEGKLRLGCEVEAVRLEECGGGGGGGAVLPSGSAAASTRSRTVAVVEDDEGRTERFDHVVFACGAPAALRALKRFSSDTASSGGWLALPRALAQQCWHWLATATLRNVRYVESRDALFSSGEAHSDSAAALPPQFEGELLQRFCNYVEVQGGDGDGGGALAYENTFIVSSWSPPALAPDVAGQRPMLVSYGCKERLRNTPAALFERNVTGREAHPCLTTTNLALSTAVWPRLQGLHGGALYFAGSSVTPGNGHDLSLLSGLVVAAAVGAPFPFVENEAALSDFHALQGMMGLG